MGVRLTAGHFQGLSLKWHHDIATTRHVNALSCQLKLGVCCVCLQAIYKGYLPNGSMTLQHFIIIFGVLQLLLSQLPNIHALRGLNLLSTMATLGFATVATAMSIVSGHNMDRSTISYALEGDQQLLLMSAFAALGTIAFRWVLESDRCVCSRVIHIYPDRLFCSLVLLCYGSLLHYISALCCTTLLWNWSGERCRIPEPWWHDYDVHTVRQTLLLV